MTVRSWSRARLGHRGGFLLLVGCTWILIGVGYLASGIPTAQWLPFLAVEPWSSIAAWLWIVAGAAALTAAPRRMGEDGYGFTALQLPAAVWLLVQLAVWGMSWDFGPWADDIGTEDGWLGLLRVGVIAGILYLVAGWPDAREPGVVTRREVPAS